METKFNIGSYIYFEGAYNSGVQSGTIVDIFDHTAFDGKEIKYYTVSTDFGKRNVIADNAYATREECITAMKANSRTLIAKYKSEIDSVNDLVAFGYTHCFSDEEYTNYEARCAYRERAKELLGLEFGAT